MTTNLPQSIYPHYYYIYLDKEVPIERDVNQLHKEADTKNIKNKVATTENEVATTENREENNSDTDISSISEFVASDAKVKVGFSLFF